MLFDASHGTDWRLGEVPTPSRARWLVGPKHPKVGSTNLQLPVLPDPNSSSSHSSPPAS